MCCSTTCTDTPLPAFTKARRVSFDDTPPTKARKVSFAGIGTEEEEEQRTLRGHARRKQRKERRQRRKLKRLADLAGKGSQFAAMEASDEKEREEFEAQLEAQQAKAREEAREEFEVQQRERKARQQNELEAELQKKAFDILKDPSNLDRLLQIWANPSRVDDDSEADQDLRYHNVTGNFFRAAGCPLAYKTPRAKYEWFHRDVRSLKELLERPHVAKYLLRLGKKNNFIGCFEMIAVDAASPASSEGSGRLHDADTPTALAAATPELKGRPHSTVLAFLPMASPALSRSPVRQQEQEAEELEEGEVDESQSFLPATRKPEKIKRRKRAVSLSEDDEQEQVPATKKARVEPKLGPKKQKKAAKTKHVPQLNFGQQASILQGDQFMESDADVAARYADGGHPFGHEDWDESSDSAAKTEQHYYRNFTGRHFFLEIRN